MKQSNQYNEHFQSDMHTNQVPLLAGHRHASLLTVILFYLFLDYGGRGDARLACDHSATRRLMMMMLLHLLGAAEAASLLRRIACDRRSFRQRTAHRTTHTRQHIGRCGSQPQPGVWLTVIGFFPFDGRLRSRVLSNSLTQYRCVSKR